MELPTEIIEAVAPAAPDRAPARATRSAQRRRAAAGVPAPVEASPVTAAPAIDPVEVDPATVIYPPATVLADTAEEDQIMDTVDTAANTASEAVKNTGEQVAGNGQAAFADMNGRAKEAMSKAARMAEELGAFGKGNLEAMVESSKIAAKGLETLGQEAAEFGRKQFESATAAMKTLAATRSPTEFMKLQSDYARSMFDMLVAESSKSTEMMMKLANDVAQPLSNRAALAAEKMKVAA